CFPTSERAGEIADDAHRAMADLLNARSADEIVFGQNMTTLTLHVSRSIGREFKPGDEIVLSLPRHGFLQRGTGSHGLMVRSCSDAEGGHSSEDNARFWWFNADNDV
ncbi:MAG TPA: aminotransferase class V-fold PLP-dependent enzyme, partial [Longimicrobiales bacterium]|nr:aminotransferase class V-fold PLP-dependent enzyme [Longimicrobiales bacterium]